MNIAYAESGLLTIDPFMNQPVAGKADSNNVKRPVDLTQEMTSLFLEPKLISDFLNIPHLDFASIIFKMYLENGGYNNSDQILKSGSYDLATWGLSPAFFLDMNKFISVGAAFIFSNKELKFLENNDRGERVKLEKWGFDFFAFKPSDSDKNSFLFNVILNLGSLTFKQIFKPQDTNGNNVQSVAHAKSSTFSKFGGGVNFVAGYRLVFNSSTSSSIEALLQGNFVHLQEASKKDQIDIENNFREYADKSQTSFNFIPTVKINAGSIAIPRSHLKLKGGFLTNWSLPLYKSDAHNHSYLDKESQEKLEKIFTSKMGDITEAISIGIEYDQIFNFDLGVSFKQSLGEKSQKSWAPYAEIMFNF
ncbi:MAG: hypothetical protein ISN64_00180 [Rickettsia sp.]|nr:hypothetical protein [Rickettsia sp.]